MKITYANTKKSAVRMPSAVPPSDATNDTIVDGSRTDAAASDACSSRPTDPNQAMTACAEACSSSA